MAMSGAAAAPLATGETGETGEKSGRCHMTVRAVMLVALLLAFGGNANGKDGAPSRLFPYYEEDTGVLRLGQAVHVAARSEIIDSGRHYEFLLSTGISDADLGEGRLIVVRVYCCGGRIEQDQALWAYVPPGSNVETGDFVELQMGRVPGKDDPGIVNKVTAVRQKNADAGNGPCRWEPDNPSLWMRIVYCEGIDRNGWLQRKGMRKMWFKQAGWVTATPSVAASTETPSPTTTSAVAAPAVAIAAKSPEPVSGSTGPSQAASPAVAAASVATTGGMACFFVTVRPGLRKAVQAAAAKTAPPTQIRFEGEAGADQCERTLDLAFASVVDRSGQTRNQSGAAVGGLATVLLGSITPWSCPTTHTLNATVTKRQGEQLGSYQAQRQQKRVGTMLACGDVEVPNDTIVTELVSEILREMATSTALPAVEPATN